MNAQTSTALDPTDAALLDRVQRETLRYFWEFAHPVSQMARERSNRAFGYGAETVTTGGTGFGIMALIVGVARGWLDRAETAERLNALTQFLATSPTYHGVFPHFMNGDTGTTIPFMQRDNGGDIVETSFLISGLLCARTFFDGPGEAAMRDRIDRLWDDVDWRWHARGEKGALLWHWSPEHGWAMNHSIRGWNECLITYLLAAGSRTHAIDPATYHEGWTNCSFFQNGRTYHDVVLPLGLPSGGPLFFTHYSFMGLDPRQLRDRYADYWQQNTAHAEINYRHCVENPNGYKGYGRDCWGLTASDSVEGYAAHAPGNDRGVITPTAALASIPYTPEASLRALHFFDGYQGGRLWGDYGLMDAFSPHHDWIAASHLAIDQAPIVVMIENYRSGLMWDLFMTIPEVQAGLQRLDFQAPVKLVA
ncbi:MAG: glucoamylase family protein [Pseudomonadota bacterium]